MSDNIIKQLLALGFVAEVAHRDIYAWQVAHPSTNTSIGEYGPLRSMPGGFHISGSSGRTLISALLTHLHRVHRGHRDALDVAFALARGEAGVIKAIDAYRDEVVLLAEVAKVALSQPPFIPDLSCLAELGWEVNSPQSASMLNVEIAYEADQERWRAVITGAGFVGSTCHWYAATALEQIKPCVRLHLQRADISDAIKMLRERGV